jgi:hypothetical protein
MLALSRSSEWKLFADHGRIRPPLTFASVRKDGEGLDCGNWQGHDYPAYSSNIFGHGENHWPDCWCAHSSL